MSISIFATSRVIFLRRAVQLFRNSTQRRHFSDATRSTSKVETFSNQDIVTSRSNSLRNLREDFKTDSIKYTFGYGLGVFPQAGYENNPSKPQIDLVHVVNDSVDFHTTNTKQFPGHYSFLRLLGVPAIVKVQEFGAGVYYNPYVSMKDSEGNENMIKYGVVTVNDLLKDLTEWNTFYLAGRLQKPVRHIYEVDSQLKRANQYNIESAFNLSLILLALGKKSSLTKKDLYEKIALLSYMGDPRMLVGGENPNKVKNIVKRQTTYFEQLYAPSFDLALEKGFAKLESETLLPTKSAEKFAEIIASLPKQFRLRVAQSYKKNFREKYHPDSISDKNSTFLTAVSNDTHLRRTLMTTILAITATPALVQSVKGILTAGVAKSAKYAWEKKMKSLVRN